MTDLTFSIDVLAVERPDSLIRKVEKQLREAIMSGYLRPGQKLIERELCDAMGISRPSLREALRTLEAERLVEIVPRKGPVVTAITEQEAAELYELRVLLESHAARQFAIKASDAEIGALRAAVQELRNAAESTNKEDLLRAKAKFYQVLLAGCGNSVMADVLGTLLSRVNRLRSASLSQPGRLPESIKELDQLVACVAARDVDGAENIARTHVRNAEKAAMSFLRETMAEKNGGATNGKSGRG